MIVDRRAARMWSPARTCHREDIEVRTPGGLVFVDLTGLLTDIVARSGIAEGLLSVQSLHTTAAIVVNENEPLLLQDLRATLGVAGGRPRLGRWQSVFLLELDGPRTRTAAVTVLGA